MRQALVLGGTGFVGSYIVKELLSDGIHVLATCRNIQNSQWVKDLGGVDKQSIVSLHEFEYGRDGKPDDDTSTKVLTEGLLPGTDAIFFCIGYEKQEPETVTYMVNACLTILDAAKQEMEKSNKKVGYWKYTTLYISLLSVLRWLLLNFKWFVFLYSDNRGCYIKYREHEPTRCAIGCIEK